MLNLSHKFGYSIPTTRSIENREFDIREQKADQLTNSTAQDYLTTSWEPKRNEPGRVNAENYSAAVRGRLGGPRRIPTPDNALKHHGNWFYRWPFRKPNYSCSNAKTNITRAQTSDEQRSDDCGNHILNGEGTDYYSRMFKKNTHHCTRQFLLRS